MNRDFVMRGLTMVRAFALSLWIAAQISCADALAAQGAQQQAAPHIAQGAAYTYSPPAQYSLTQDNGDATQLTDGKYVPGSGNMWSSREAVGWSLTPSVDIEIDLGNVKAVDQVCVRTARGSPAGVSFPRRIDVFLSQDRQRYAWAGNAIAGQDASDGPFLAARFCANAGQREAR